MNIHMIDDDENIYDLLHDYFDDTTFDLTYSDNPIKGIDYVKGNNVDLVLLDLMLPEIDGFEVCKKLREMKPLLPIIMLTAKKDDFDKIVGLELGADDYISKPFNPRELLARIKTVLRRIERSEQIEKIDIKERNESIIYSSTWDIKMNLDSRTVYHKDTLLDFTTTEFELLKCLMENSGIVQSRDSLMNKVKGIDFESFDRTIDVFISKIRQKLSDDPRKQEIIKTIRNIGYIFTKL